MGRTLGRAFNIVGWGEAMLEVPDTPDSERRVAYMAAVQLAMYGLFVALAPAGRDWAAPVVVLVWLAAVGIGLAALLTSPRRGPRAAIVAVVFLVLEVRSVMTTTRP